MAQLKLAKLPNRIPVKHTIMVTPELEQKLSDYAHRYKEAYAEEESIDALIPFILDAFLNSDRDFKSGLKKQQASSKEVPQSKDEKEQKIHAD